MVASPRLMQAVVLAAHGRPLRLVQVSRPYPAPCQVLVRVIANAVGAETSATGSPSSRLVIERLGARFVDRAHRAIEAGSARGKLVVDVAGEAGL